MSLENYEQSLDCKMGTIPRIGPRVIKGITIGERHSEVEQTFGRKPKSRRAELVTREAKRALEYIQERQLAEKAALTAAEEGSVLTDDASLNSFLARPKEPLSEKPFKKSTASVLMDLFEDKKGRNYEVNFLGSPVKERWFKEEEYGGVNFMEPSLADTVDTTNSTSSSTQSKRRKGNLFITDQGSVMSSQKFITQRSHVLAEGLHVTDETPDRIKKYFGDDSKGRFYDTYRELRRQKLLLPITKDTHGRIVTDLNKLISCTSTDHPVNKSIADLVALGVIRPSTSSPSANPVQRMDSAVSELFNINSFQRIQQYEKIVSRLPSPRSSI